MKESILISTCAGANNVIIGENAWKWFVGSSVMQAEGSYVIDDPYGDLYRTYKTFLSDNGYKVIRLDLSDPSGSCRYNPLSYVSNDEDIEELACALIKSTDPKGKHSADPFWIKTETSLLASIITYLYYHENSENQTLPSVMKLLGAEVEFGYKINAGAANPVMNSIMELLKDDENSPIIAALYAYMMLHSGKDILHAVNSIRESKKEKRSPLDCLFEYVGREDPESRAAGWYETFKAAAWKMKDKIALSCMMRLRALSDQAVKELTADDDMELGRIWDRKTAVFVICSDANRHMGFLDTPDTGIDFLSTIMYMQLFRMLIERCRDDGVSYAVTDDKGNVIRCFECSSECESDRRTEAEESLEKIRNGTIRYNAESGALEITSSDGKFVAGYGSVKEAEDAYRSLKNGSVIKSRTALPIPVKIMLNRPEKAAAIPGLDLLIATAGGRGVSVSAAAPSVSALREKYGSCFCGTTANRDTIFVCDADSGEKD